MADVLRLFRENKFEKDLEKSNRRKKDLSKLWNIIKLLIKNQSLPAKYRDHKLKGEYVGYRECHIEPDWLLIYKKTTTHLILARTGSHSDLF